MKLTDNTILINLGGEQHASDPNAMPLGECVDERVR